MTEKKTSEEFYVQRKPSGFLGNAPVWWREGDCGYSAYLEQARRFAPEDAQKLVREDPEKWAAFPCDFIDANARRVFDCQDFHLLGASNG